ncbi:MAG: helix-turn-helix domain-containing protein [Tannerellaceae bacterium]|nr:helix-turn-helix domain-containing protein [Tannerellaceae bacterium]MCD8263939.1 helix-turn-helix domain-containing protein [Tannerellaceae bacterium]
MAHTPIDQKFLDKVNAIIDRHLDNSDFDINLLAKELGVSRSSLYTKFKALTGTSPNEFVINSKLKRAATLLKNNPELQIADIASQLGFSSPRYFSQCFKTQFHISPAEYRKSKV